MLHVENELIQMILLTQNKMSRTESTLILLYTVWGLPNAPEEKIS